VLNDPVNFVDPLGLEQVRNGIIYDDDGNLIGEVGLAAPNPFLDPINYVAGGLFGSIKNAAAKVAGSCPSGSGGVVIGKLKDLNKSGALRTGERLLGLPDRGASKLNWRENSSRLREAMSKGQPIRDASADSITGALRDNTGFLRAERNLLGNQGWKYNSQTQYWHAPGH
jgi:hypothetical protein